MYALHERKTMLETVESNLNTSKIVEAAAVGMSRNNISVCCEPNPCTRIFSKGIANRRGVFLRSGRV